MRIFPLFFAALCTTASLARAQGNAAGPLILLLPASARAASLGNAWVAGRDEYSLFYNPAQITTSSTANASVTRYASNGTFGALTGATTVNWLTIGWGVELVEFKARTAALYPFAPAELTKRGTVDALSLALAGGGTFLVKGFRTGVGIKYAEDRVDGHVGAFAGPSLLHGVLLADAGLSHPFLSGTAALAVQNIGDESRLRLPIQTTLGWARQLSAGPYDIAFTGEVLERNRWLGGGGGLEVGYGWIEGWSVAARAGARRPDTRAQRPVSLGGTLNADHLSLDYGLELFESSQFAHHISIRWRS